MTTSRQLPVVANSSEAKAPFSMLAFCAILSLRKARMFSVQQGKATRKASAGRGKLTKVVAKPEVHYNQRKRKHDSIVARYGFRYYDCLTAHLEKYQTTETQTNNEHWQKCFRSCDYRLDWARVCGRDCEENSCGIAITLGMTVPCHHCTDMLRFMDSPVTVVKGAAIGEGIRSSVAAGSGPVTVVKGAAIGEGIRSSVAAGSGPSVDSSFCKLITLQREPCCIKDISLFLFKAARIRMDAILGDLVVDQNECGDCVNMLSSGSLKDKFSLRGCNGRARSCVLEPHPRGILKVKITYQQKVLKAEARMEHLNLPSRPLSQRAKRTERVLSSHRLRYLVRATFPQARSWVSLEAKRLAESSRFDNLDKYFCTVRVRRQPKRCGLGAHMWQPYEVTIKPVIPRSKSFNRGTLLYQTREESVEQMNTDPLLVAQLRYKRRKVRLRRTNDDVLSACAILRWTLSGPNAQDVLSCARADRSLRGDLLLTYDLFEQNLSNRFFTVDAANTREGAWLYHGTTNGPSCQFRWRNCSKKRLKKISLGCLMHLSIKVALAVLLAVSESLMTLFAAKGLGIKRLGFEKDKPNNIPPVLEDYIRQIARNGQTMIPWIYIKPLLLHKFNKVVDGLLSDSGASDSMAVSPVTAELRQRVYDTLKRLDGIPFTIQRICELLENPFRHYSRPDKYLRGFEKVMQITAHSNIKVCMVVSTVDPHGKFPVVKESQSSGHRTFGALAMSLRKMDDSLDKQFSRQEILVVCITTLYTNSYGRVRAYGMFSPDFITSSVSELSAKTFTSRNLVATSCKSTVDPVGQRDHHPTVESHNSSLLFFPGHTTRFRPRHASQQEAYQYSSSYSKASGDSIYEQIKCKA
ncbi:serine/threonine-protein phosphatase 4 regulatory subunit 2-A [Clonorchis sinensis]|uniref:Serine/threonine-protein phosphatase 4 regulatory subunit 2-A n=1 Tax=Clonorchis sinensis TaxID=79923 RepID=G7YWF7_CLOSI|nr:serine/threonine-protein phosphatase 4 regulatory subunit 2-A [Clonorchis sinensis]